MAALRSPMAGCFPQHFRQFVRGYAVTSYASQGKSVDHVLFSDSAVKAATNQQQWYVTISRGKGVQIFTADKEQLRENITRSGDRPLAMDLVPQALRNSWFYSLAERRFGKRVAALLTLGRQTRISESFRQRQAQPIKPSPGISGIGMGM